MFLKQNVKILFPSGGGQQLEDFWGFGYFYVLLILL